MEKQIVALEEQQSILEKYLSDLEKSGNCGVTIWHETENTLKDVSNELRDLIISYQPKFIKSKTKPVLDFIIDTGAFEPVRDDIIRIPCIHEPELLKISPDAHANHLLYCIKTNTE